MTGLLLIAVLGLLVVLVLILPLPARAEESGPDRTAVGGPGADGASSSAVDGRSRHRR